MFLKKICFSILILIQMVYFEGDETSLVSLFKNLSQCVHVIVEKTLRDRLDPVGP